MAKLTWRGDELVADLRKQFTGVFDRAGEKGKEIAAVHTPTGTGFAARSLHHVVLDEAGRQVAGNLVDGNGNAVPDYPPAAAVTLVVGSNTAPKTGEAYFRWIELGQGGQPGHAPLSQGLDATEAAIADELRRMRR